MQQRRWGLAKDWYAGAVAVPLDRRGRVEQRLRRMSVGYYLVATIVGLCIVYSPLGDGSARVSIATLIPLVAAAMMLAGWFPWHRFPRDAFIFSTLGSLVLVGLLVGWSGGWRSPFPLFSFYAIVFAALYFRARYALIVALASILVWVAPLCFGQLPPGGWREALSLVLVAATTSLGITQLAQAMKGEFSSLHRDVTARREFEEQLRHQAYHDALTSLPNRVMLTERLEGAIATATPGDERLGLIFLDLDRFKLVNDSLGHEAGDLLLNEVARRMATCLRQRDTLARLGGDEFVVLLDGEIDEAAAIGVAERLLAALLPPIALADHELFINASIGIAIATRGQLSASDLLRNADIALYRAKQAGRGRYALFDPAMNRAAAERLALETSLRRAIQHDQFAQFSVYYQPIIDLSTGRIAGVEALARWQSPEHGSVPPGVFIPLAEELGLILPLGRWVLQQACHEGANWHRRFPDRPRLKLNVNVSVRQFLQPDLVEMVDQVLAATGFPPSSLQIEITESVLMADTGESSGKIGALQQLGVQLAIDDFGTGYSSLAYLKRLSAVVLKIDKTFTDGIVHDARNSSIAQSVIALGLALGLAVTAEGIESPEELQRLRELGCAYGQGYYFARPMSADAFEQFLGSEQGQPLGELALAGLD